MKLRSTHRCALCALLFGMSLLAAKAQSFRVQCPTTTNLHPSGKGIKCQEVSGGDGFATMADGTQIYLFGFGPLSGLADIKSGLSGTETNTTFNLGGGDPNGAVGLLDAATGLVRPADMMNVGVLNANAPAPLISMDEDDELFLTLSNVGMIMRPDLFEQHTVHFHGYPNASSYFDGVPDASVAINIGGSFTYYYTAPDAGTYFWHCHITPPEHLQMGMVGQLYVRPRQNRLQSDPSFAGKSLASILQTENAKAPGATSGIGCSDILCTGQTPVPANPSEVRGNLYAYNDGDGSTRYDVEFPVQMMGFDPFFHYVGTTFNPESFAGMKDKYFLLSGRGYPDTVSAGPMETEGSDGQSRPSQPLPTLITINKSAGQTRALLRLSDLSVTEFTTLATVGIPMRVVGIDARLLRDMAGNDMTYLTNSVTLGGGESADVILDATDVPPGTYFLYSSNLDHLSNFNENFGGMMTEIVVK
ncbi:multicopper oxidase family protein [Acidobacteria bacterium AB60]|nr:multicopper oxidase family protein [Acidobacteria bacterium AB60]